MKMAARIERMNPNTPERPNHYMGLTKRVNGKSVWTDDVTQASLKTLHKPMDRKKPTTYFVNSMGDLFADGVPDEWIDKVFAVMAICPQHTFQLLTKRPERAREYLKNVEERVFNLVCDMVIQEEIQVALSATPDADGRAKSFGLNVVRLHHWPLANVWLGTSVEGQASADSRIPDLLASPAAVRFISAEPLLGPVDLGAIKSPEMWGENSEGWTFDCL